MSENASKAEFGGGPGSVLLTERRRQSLSLGDVSRQLKLSVRQVEALERDDFTGFQSPVFIHGFLRNYAKLLGVDPDPLVRAADNLINPPPAPVAPEKMATPSRVAEPHVTKKSRWPLFAGIAAVIVVAGLLVMNSRAPQPLKPKPAAEPTSQVAGVQGQPEKRSTATAPVEKTPTEKPPVEKRLPEKHADQKPVLEKTADKPFNQSGQETPKAPHPTPSAAIGEAGAARMVIRMIFEQDSWVEVKDRNGNTVFGQLNAAGSRRSASGEPPLTIVVGNAAGVRLFQGDKSIDLAPHTRVDVARLTIE